MCEVVRMNLVLSACDSGHHQLVTYCMWPEMFRKYTRQSLLCPVLQCSTFVFWPFLVLIRVSQFQSLLMPLTSYSSSHSRMRSKRLRTTEEPVGLDGSSALNSSKRKGMGGPSEPKVRRSVAGTTCREEEKERRKEANSKHNQNQNSAQLPGKRLTQGTGGCLRLLISL